MIFQRKFWRDHWGSFERVWSSFPSPIPARASLRLEISLVDLWGFRSLRFRLQRWGWNTRNCL